MPNPHTDFELARHSAHPVALVTGATGGMGSAIVRELAATHRVIAVGRGREELAKLADETGAVPWAVDLTDGAALAEHAGASTGSTCSCTPRRGVARSR